MKLLCKERLLNCLPARCLLLSCLLSALLRDGSSIDVMIPHNHDYKVLEGETATMTCQVGCEHLGQLQYEWKLQVPHYKRSIIPLNRLTTDFIPTDLFTHFNTEQTNTTNCRTTSNTHHFYLKLYGVKAGLNNSIVKCGVSYQGSITYASAGKFIFVTKPAPPDPGVSTKAVANYATHSGVQITCRHSCHLNTGNIQYLWMIQSLALQRVELHDRDKKLAIEKELHVQMNLTSGDGKCDATNKTDFYLDIVGMSPLLQHAVVSCGVRVDMDSPEIYSSTDSYIVINQTKVAMASPVLNATDSGVVIECEHTCNKGEEFQYLWKLRAFGYGHLKHLYLHDYNVRTTVEKELGINISMTSSNGCWGDSMRSFYLNISGMNKSLQHAIVSCGVTIVNSSTEVYSTHNGYILLSEDMDDAHTTMTTGAPTTPTKTVTEATTTEAINRQSVDTLNASTIAPSAAGAALLFGFLCGILFSVMVCFFKKKIHSSSHGHREDPTDTSDLSRDHNYTNRGYLEVSVKSPTTNSVFDLQPSSPITP